MNKFLFWLMLLFSVSSLFAATNCPTTATADCKYNLTANQLAAQIQGIGITITNPHITHGAGTQLGTFSNGKNGANLEIDQGLILTGMTVKESFTTNSSWHTSLQPSGQYNDPDLLAIDNRAHYNPVVFEFDVTLDANTRLLLLDYQFASEEYNEYVGSQFNDSFGFFVSGGDLNQTYNIARVVDNQTYVTIDNIDNYPPVTVNNVNQGSVGDYDDNTPQDLSNSSYFINNCDKDNIGNHNCTQKHPPVDVEYDGITHILHATLDNLTPGETYHFKIALADTADSQWDTGVFVNKISGLREPSLCYDYSYKQDGSYLTAGFDPNHGPYIDASGIPSDPVEVSMYIKNTKDSEITTSNISVDVLDINTTQATYIPESVSVTDAGNLAEQSINDSDLNITSNSIRDIPIASFDAFEFFYVYFSLDPKTSNLSLPINTRIAYDLTIPLSPTQNLTINRTSFIDKDIPICGGGGSDFNVTYGLFNVIESDHYTNDTTYDYNINTQVVNRAPQLSVVSVDANSTDLHDLQPVTTVVGIDILDLKSFHDTEARCSESKNTLSDERIWAVFNNSTITPLDTNGINLFAKAAEDAALRIAYFDDGNGTLLTLEPVTKNGETRWNVRNFPDLVKNGSCLANISNGTDTVAHWCSNAGKSFASAMTKSELNNCLKCVYGYNTNLVCARDNFSVRPEALMIHINDQGPNKTTIPGIKLTNNMTGVVAPTQNHLDLAAGYRYDLDVNATNHQTNDASGGYSAIFNDTAGAVASFIWAPRAGKDVSGCNDTTDHNNTVKIWAGQSYDSNTTINQTGDYMLHLEDTSWTTVDSIPPAHHSLPHFSSGSDCVLNSNYAATTSEADSLTGCNISSSHTNAENNTQYKDINITLHPYKFDLNATGGGSPITPTIGLLFAPVSNAKPYIYIADINNSLDENMSYHLNGSINAVGENNITLTNFVDQCYATPLDINISTSDRDLNDSNGNHVDYRVRFHDLNSSNQVITALDMNVTDDATTSHTDDILFQTVQTATKGYFPKTQNGSMQTLLNMNYAREKNTTINPTTLTFIKYQVNCTNPTNDCTFNADSINNQTTQGAKDLNSTIPIRHYYGRTHSVRQTFTTPVGTASKPAQALIYYEAYCNGATCNKTLLQDGNNSKITDDPRWFINTQHTVDKGSARNVRQKGGTVVTTDTNPSGNAPDSALIVYDATKGYPYKTTMENNASNWLIYNRFNPNAQTNEFQVEFLNGGANWNGAHETNTTSVDGGTSITNRRVMW